MAHTNETSMAKVEDDMNTSEITSDAEHATELAVQLNSVNTSPRNDEQDVVAKTPRSLRKSSLGSISVKASLKRSPSVPDIIVSDESARPLSRSRSQRWGSLRRRPTTADPSSPAVPPLPAFEGIALDIPSGSLSDILPLPSDSLDRRDVPPSSESIIESPKSSLAPHESSLQQKQSFDSLDRKDSLPSSASMIERPKSSLVPRQISSRQIKSATSLRGRPSSRAISTDDEALSNRVRLMYDRGIPDISDAEVVQMLGRPDNGILSESSVADEVSSLTTTIPESKGDAIGDGTVSNTTQTPSYAAPIEREKNELAGGIEDWENVRIEDVDRYGFIIPHRENNMEHQPLQRVSTSLHLASSSPRRRLTLRREPSTAASNRSFLTRSESRSSSILSSKPISSQSVSHTGIIRYGSTLRYATNRLPHNRNRKFVDEAGDMLTNPDEAIQDHADTPLTRMMKKKEWEREDKWRNMAKISPSEAGLGGGMKFEFDTKSPKLVERTWKGIPDRWRSTAWHSFLSASAKQKKGSPTEEELIASFNDLQEEPSPDDLQIDLDVPRTIGRHIMFRRRYRGGQRLLFRVLHAMSLYFPDTGYVQGMASIASTLLAYYEEEQAFVMLVRLWQLRGLDRLYRKGFSGLLEALDNFERDWLQGGEVSEKLVLYIYSSDQLRHTNEL